MNVVMLEDVRTKRLLREFEERMDYVAITYLDLMIDICEQMYDDDLNEDNWQEFCEHFETAFSNSLERVCEEKGL